MEARPLILLVALWTPAQAADWKASAGADLSARSRAYSENVASNTAQTEQMLRLSPWASARYKRAIKGRVNPEAQWDPVNPSQRERAYVDVREAYIQGQTGPLSLQLGYQQFNWGVTDVFQPMDALNTRRYFDPLAGEKLAAPAAALRAELGFAAIDAVYIPWQRASILPGEQSRWLPRDIYRTRSTGGSEPARIILPSTLDYRYRDQRVLDNALRGNYGARISRQFPGADLTAAYFEGAAPAPATELALSGTIAKLTPVLEIRADPRVEVTPIQYRQRTYGGSAVVSAWGTLVKWEGAYTQVISKRVSVPGSSQAHALEFERGFDVGGRPLTAILEGTYVVRREKAENSGTSLARMFDRAAIAALRYQPTEQLTLLGSGLYDTVEQGQLWHLEAGYKLRDGLSVSLTAQILSGGPETPLGTYSRNDRATAGLLWQL